MANKTTLPEKTTFPEDAIPLTRVKFPPADEGGITSGFSLWTADLANVGDRIIPWGENYDLRDKELREFWPTESYLAGAIYSVCISNAAYEWEIQVKGKGRDGTRLETVLTDMLNGALVSNGSFGWIPFVTTYSEDFYTQDNGGFIELIRDPSMDAASRFRGQNAPVIGIAQLDASKCKRTGNPQIPVVYRDREGQDHKLQWYEVIAQSEFPSSLQEMNGVGFSAITRVLRIAQIVKSIEIYKDEKIGGRVYRAIHFVSGIAKTEIDDALLKESQQADNKGFIRFITPAIITSLDPERPVTTATIELAGLPDSFDLDQEMKWYISGIALGLGRDYQDLAPLPTGNIGSSQQSEILHRKSRGKGPRHFMQSIQNWFRDYGVIPYPAELAFKLKDTTEEMEETEKFKEMAELLAILRRANIIDGRAAREAVRQWNMLPSDILELISEDFGNEEFGTTRQMLGTSGGTTTGEDAKRVEKNLIGRLKNALQAKE